MALISQSDLEARLGRSLTTDEASAFTIINEANQAFVERMLGVSVEEASETDRLYDGGRIHTPIDLCTEISAIKLVDEDLNDLGTVDTSDYTLEPANRTLKQQLRYRYGKIPMGYNSIQVSAKFSTYGDTTATAIVKNALLDMAEMGLSNSDNLRKESIEGYSVEYGEIKETASIKQLKTLQPAVI